MYNRIRDLLLVSGLVTCALTPVFAQQPNLAGGWIRNGGTVDFGAWDLTEEGQRRFDAYDFNTDDPALHCLASSWTRVWLNPNVLVEITQGEDRVRLRHEWMDIDRRIPIVDPAAANPPRAQIEGQPALGRFMAWYDGDTLVVDTIDVAPGYVSTMQEWAGLPQSRTMRTVERISRSGDLLTIEITHVDPAMYRRPLVVTITYPPSEFELLDYGCNPEDAAIIAPNR